MIKKYKAAALATLVFAVTASSAGLVTAKTAPGAVLPAVNPVGNNDGVEVGDTSDQTQRPEVPAVTIRRAPNGDITLTWNRVKVKGLEGDPAEGSVTYRILRGDIWTEGGCDTLVTNLADTTYVDYASQLTPPRRFRYKVTAYYNGVADENEGVYQGSKRGGGAGNYLCGYYSTPLDRRYWKCDYSVDNTLGKVYDIAGDYTMWSTYKTGIAPSPETGKTFGVLCIRKQSQRDDWFMTPPIKVKAGRSYAVRAYFGSEKDNFSETLGIFGGYANTVEGMTDSIVPYTTEKGKDMHEITGTFTATQDTMYYLGFHAKTDGTFTPGYLYLYGYDIDGGCVAGTPAEAKDVEYGSAGDGSLAVNVSFTTPAFDIDGKPLANLKKVELKRGDVIVNTWTSPMLGEPFTFTDTPEGIGIQDYELTAYSNKGAGRTVKFSVYAGLNTPERVTGVTAEKVGDTDVNVSWNPVTKDVAGLEVNPDYVKYNVYLQSSAGERLLASEVTGTTGTFRVAEPGKTAYGRILVKAVTPSGESTPAVQEGNLHFGPALPMPWGESFRLGIPEAMWGYEDIDPTGVELYYYTSAFDSGQDNDAGSARFERTTNYGQNILGVSTPLIHVSGDNPRARIYLQNNSGSSDNYVEVAVDDGTGWKTYGKLITKLISGWQPLDISLAEYAGKDVRVRFGIHAVNILQTYVDNLMVYNAADDNLGIQSVKAAYNSVVGGNANKIYVKVRNYGKAESAAGTCSLERDGKAIGTVEVPAIDPFEDAIVEFSDDVPTGVESVNYTASLQGTDAVADDNTKTENITVIPSNRPRPSELAGSSKEGKAVLTWTAADDSNTVGDVVTETFEEYESLATTGIGDWTLVDKDNQRNQKFSKPTMEGVDNCETSWFVVDQTIPKWFAGFFDCYPMYEGNKCLGSRKTANNYDGALYGNNYADDWAISPELPGIAQTVSLIASDYSLRVSFYASSTGKNIEDFVKLRTRLDDLNEHGITDRHRIDLMLPEGTKYFAVRHHPLENQSACDLAMVDLVRFVPAAKGLDILGYNVYCDGTRLNDTPVTETTYTCMPGTGTHTYYVKAVTAKGESEPTNTVTFEVSGLDAIGADAVTETARFNAAGQEVDSNYRGVVIVKYSDGTAVKKVIR